MDDLPPTTPLGADVAGPALVGNGVRQVPVALLPELADAAWHAGFVISHVALAGITDKAGVLQAFASGLAFPPGMGGNWDALADALGDLSWLEGQAHGILIDGVAQLRQHAPDVLATLLDIIDEAAQQWTAYGQPFQVFVAEQAMPMDAG